jgi:hypothetical protein
MRWAILCTAILMSGGEDARGRPGVASVDTSEPDHQERQLVRAWLRENVVERRWEEVEWSSAITMNQVYEDQAQKAQRNVDESERLMKEDPENSEQHAAERDRVERERRVWRDGLPKSRCIRLKYRTENQIGNRETRLQVFSLGSVQAFPARKGLFDKYFPEPAGD